MRKTILVFILIFVCFMLNAEKLSVLSELSNPGAIQSDGEKIFIIDGHSVFVYSLKTNQYLYQFGKRGEGPGELMALPDVPLTMTIAADKIIINSFNKMVIFSKNGTYEKELKLPFRVFQIIPFGQNYVATKFHRNRKGGSSLEVNLYSNKLDYIKTIYSSTLLNDQGKGKIAYPLLSTKIMCSEKTLYIVDQLKDFQINLYDLKGNKLNQIEKNLKKIKIDEQYKKESLAFMKLQPAFRTAPDRIREMIYFLDYLPAIDNFTLSDQNIFVQTSLTKNEKAEFIILDNSGNIQRKIMLPNAKVEAIRATPITNFMFVNDHYYYLIDVDEEWELHRIKL